MNRPTEAMVSLKQAEKAPLVTSKESTRGLRAKGAPSLLRDSKIYTPREIAEALRVSAVTVSRAIREGKLRAFRVGGQWRVSGRMLRHTSGLKRCER